jgi:hypothetical protein
MALKEINRQIKYNFTTKLKNFNGSIRSVKSDLGVAYELAAKETAAYLADRIDSYYFTDREGNIRDAVRQAYKVDYPNAVYIGDEKKMDRYFRENVHTERSVYNTRKYIPYWHFIAEGWGLFGGKRKRRYKLFVVIYDEENQRTTRTSPFNPRVKNGEVQVLAVARHPGREARNWFVDLRDEYMGVFNKKSSKYIKVIFDKYSLL